MRSDKANVVVDKSTDFASRILLFCERLDEMKKFTLSNQLSKSGTSIGANIWEAQNSESITDFIHKMKIAAKEASETKFWLIVCRNMLKNKMEFELLDDIEEILKLLGKIISSSKAKQKNGNS